MHLQTCADLEPLLAQLAARLRVPLSNPMAEEIIVVPAADTAHYLKRELGRLLGDAGKDNGVVANVRFVYPRELINATANHPMGLSDSPWDAMRLTWTIASLLHDIPGDVLPRAFVQSPLAASRRIADLFDRYASHRPETLRGWAMGHKYDVVSNGNQDWQVDLYQRVSAQLLADPAARHSVADISAYVEELDHTAIPERISVFGVDSLSRAALAVLYALDKHTDIAMFWVYALGAQLPSPIEDGSARKEYVQNKILHPLYSRWGAHVLEARGLVVSEHIDTRQPVSRGTSLLDEIQNSVLSNTFSSVALTDSEMSALLQQGDGSLQVHACYGLTRQVEALRDAVLHQLNSDPTLRLRDILLVCSDVKTVAPILKSIFDPQETVGDNTPRLPINVLRGANVRLDEYSQSFFAVLELAAGRCSASQLLDTASLAPIRRKFGFDDDALAMLENWSKQLGIQHGISAHDRSRWNISSSIENGTWQAAIDRLLMGFAVPAERDIKGPAGVVPFDGIGTSEIDTAGALAEFLVRLTHIINRIRTSHADESLTIGQWSELLTNIIDNFIEPGYRDTESLVNVRTAIHRMVLDASKTSGIDTRAFSLRDLRLMTSEYFTRGTSDFWSLYEAITVTEFGGMNHIPFKVIAVVGAEESSFADSSGDGDDILSNEPRVGEPMYSLRGRQNLMNLLMAARKTLIVTCNGSDINSNQPVPFAVPIQELIEFSAATLSDTGIKGDHKVLVQHPRHNFDQRTLLPGVVLANTSFTFDTNSEHVYNVMNAAHLEHDSEKSQHLLTTENATATSINAQHQVRDISQALKLIADPIEYYYENILDVRIPEMPQKDDYSSPSDISGDGILSLTLDGLQHSGEGRRLLHIISNHDNHSESSWLDGVISEWQSIRPLTGLLPPGELGVLLAREIAAEISAMIRLLPPHLQDLQGNDVDCTTPIGENLVSLRIAGVTATDGRSEFARVRYARFRESMLLQSWLELAILTAYIDGAPTQAHVVARSPESRSTTPQYWKISLRGATDVERASNSHKILVALQSLSTLASQGPVDFFPSASRDIQKGDTKNIQSSLSKDAKYSSAISWYLQDRTYDDLRNEKASQHEKDILTMTSNDEISRIELYANFIWQLFDSTVDAENATPTTKDATEMGADD